MSKGLLHTVDGNPLFTQDAGQPDLPMQLIWAHGWGQSGATLLPLAESLASFASSTILDFPGFGASPPPPLTWGTADFADHAAAWLRSMGPRCRVWVGHSFGCRVGLQVAARHPGLLSGLVLMAAAGLPRNRPWPERLRFRARKYGFRMAKSLLREGPLLDSFRSRMGSADYRNAGALRPILSKVVAEDLSDVAARVTCPVLFLYGAQDVDTPPEIGYRFQKLVPNATLEVLDGFDHHSLLLAGRHQVVSRIRSFLEKTVECP